MSLTPDPAEFFSSEVPSSARSFVHTAKSTHLSNEPLAGGGRALLVGSAELGPGICIHGRIHTLTRQ